MLFEAVAKMLGSSKGAKGSKGTVASKRKGRVIDLDGPLSGLVEFVGGIGGNPSSDNTAKFHQTIKKR